MDLAVPAGDAVWVPGIRIKLHFEDRNILTSQQVDAGLLNSWFGVPPHLRCIADLASDIASSFQLSKSCPHGISLHMEKFTLPPPQPVWLLTDKDIVSVKKKNGQLTSTERDFKGMNSLSPDMKGSNGGGVCAIEEFKEQTRDYKSAKEENGRESLNELLDLVNILPKAAPTAEPKLKKKRKHTEYEGVDEQEQGHALQLVPYTGEDTKKKVKGLKKKRLTMHQDVEEDKLLNQDEVQESEKARKCRESVNLKLAEETGKKERSTQLEGRKNKRNDSGTPTVEKDDARQGSQNVLHLSASYSTRDGTVMAQEKKLLTQAEDESQKKPSRSTLRKKAKRRWKREHPEALETTKDEKPHGLPQYSSCKEDRKTDPVLQGFPAFPKKKEDDDEAEEEKLPIVVRPGHIRFGNVDEGDTENHVQHSVDIINWNNAVSKRQGQSWGQEKVQGRKSGKKIRETIPEETDDIGKIVFESLPYLKIAPQVGDIVAYRVVELTPSMCPELSEYRVGKVGEFKTRSGMLKLIALPNYPPLKGMLEDLAKGIDSDISSPSSYCEDGSLETQLASLVDVRLVRAAVNLSQGLHDSQVQASSVKASTDKHEGDPAEATVQLPNSNGDTGQGALCPAGKGLGTSSKTLMICSPTIDRTSATSHPELIGQGLSNNLASAWQDLSEMLDKKKGELSRLEVITSAFQQNGSPAVNEVKIQCGHIFAEKSPDEKTHIQNRSRSFRPRRAGALGPTMALLRAQNGL